MKKRILSLILIASSAPAVAQTAAGPATVIDGDSLTVGGKAVRLFGIDAPESKQTCERGGVSWACGEEAASQLKAIVANNPVECIGRGVDQYGRILGVCSAGGFELNAAMVEAGWATAYGSYSDAYVAQETRARTANVGIWEFNLCAASGLPSGNARCHDLGTSTAGANRADHPPSAGAVRLRDQGQSQSPRPVDLPCPRDALLRADPGRGDVLHRSPSRGRRLSPSHREIMERHQEVWAEALWIEQHKGSAGPLFIAQQIGALALRGDTAGIERWKKLPPPLISCKRARADETARDRHTI